MKTVLSAILLSLPVVLTTAHAQAEDACKDVTQTLSAECSSSVVQAQKADPVVKTIGGIAIHKSALEGLDSSLPPAKAQTEVHVQMRLSADMTDSEIREAALQIHKAYQQYRMGFTRVYHSPKKIMIDVLPGDSDEIRKQYEKDLGKLLERYLKENFGDTLQEELEVSIKGIGSKIGDNMRLNGNAEEEKVARSGVSGFIDRLGTDATIRGPVGRIKFVVKFVDIQMTEDLRGKLEYETGKEKKQSRLVLRKDLGTTVLVGNVIGHQSMVCDAGVRNWKAGYGPFDKYVINRKDKYAGCRYSIEW